MTRHRSSRPSHARRPFAGLLVIGLGASLATMDLAVNVAFPAITAAFALETRAIRWVVVWYVLTYASLMLAFGNLGDHIGHRRVFRAGLIVSVVAFVACALAPDYSLLLYARIAQGIGTALVLSCAPALAIALFAESERTRALGAYSGMVSAASLIAPLAGGAAIALLGWSGVFWFRAPIALLALVLLPLLPHARQPTQPHTLRSFELGGPALLAGGLALVLLAPSLVHTPATIWVGAISALAGGALLIACAAQQRRSPKPMLPLATLRDPDFVLPNLASIAVHFVAFAVPLLLPYHLARIGGYAPTGIGLVIATSPAGMLLGSLLAAPLARAIGARRAALIGGLVVAIGACALGAWTAAPSLVPVLLGLLLHGVGVGLFQVAYSDVVISALPPNARGIAGSLTMVTRTAGVVTAATVLTAAMQAIETRRIAAGQSELAAFADAFATVYLYAGTMLAALFLLSCLRRRPWFTT